MVTTRRPIFRLLFLGGLAIVLAAGAGCGGGSAQKPSRITVEAETLAREGSKWYDLGCFERAKPYFVQAAKANRLQDDLPGLMRALNNLGAVCLALDQLDESAEYLDEALKLNQTVRNRAQGALIHGNLAGLAFKAGRYQDAELFWKNAVADSRADEKRTALALNLSNLGMLYRTLNRLPEASSALAEAEQSARNFGQTGSLSGIKLQLGLLAQTRNRPAEAEKLLNEALELDREAVYPRGIAQDLEKLGLLFSQTGQWSKAARELDRAFFLYAALGDKKKVEQLHQVLMSNHSQSEIPESMAPYDRLLSGDDDISDSLLCE